MELVRFGGISLVNLPRRLTVGADVMGGVLRSLLQSILLHYNG